MTEFKKVKRNYKMEQLKFKLKETKRKVESFVINNKETIIGLAPVILTVGGFVVKNATKAHNMKKQENLKNLYCYDRSLGHYWKLRRELNNSEWVEIDRRKRAGEKLGDILESLKVLA